MSTDASLAQSGAVSEFMVRRQLTMVSDLPFENVEIIVSFGKIKHWSRILSICRQVLDIKSCKIT